MKITKYNHSCLLIEDDGKNTLIDPGSFSESVLNVEALPYLSYLLITHEHMDHFAIPLVKKIVAKFPDVKVITTHAVIDQLALEQIAATYEGDDYITVTEVPHERIWGGSVPENIMVTLGNKLAHPGDSHSFTTAAEILALPITAPWGNTTAAIELAEKLQPKIIIPIHDFMLKDESRRMLYTWVGSYLKQKGIDFVSLEAAEPIEL